MHARGALIEGSDALKATKDVVTAVGLPQECHGALNSLAGRVDKIILEISTHVMNIGKGTMTDDIRPILNYGSPEKNV